MGHATPAEEGVCGLAKAGGLVKLAGMYRLPINLTAQRAWWSKSVGCRGRQDKEYIRESILDPDKVIVSGISSGV